MIIDKARSLLCHIAVHDINVTVTEVARLVCMPPFAISYAVTKGKR
ncbi:MAG: hypothetical protein BWX58_00923 [Deltaproteobacteria bacterium ADurb.Bin026]|nr:MAG: hypothetical protein BWX58_00923 [Deltaproteobacteria bacterium ADurb.Bin026]